MRRSADDSSDWDSSWRSSVDPASPGRSSAAIEYRVLATSKTSTMEKELNEAAEAGFRFQAVMGGDTAIGGKEVVAVVIRSGETRVRYSYKLMATAKTSTMEKEMQAAADAGFEYRGSDGIRELSSAARKWS